uniref:Rab3 GTPase-activating protein catalytic subunit n=1 Tax=Parastrongyloides trichosuri TaxID=131310 RepID=A0A0N4ZKL7_PARTI
MNCNTPKELVRSIVEKSKGVIFEEGIFNNRRRLDPLIGEIKGIIKKWNIKDTSNENIKLLGWKSKSEHIHYENKRLVMKYFFPKFDTNLTTKERCSFYNNSPFLVNEFGIFEFIVIYSEDGNDLLKEKEDINIILSCLNCCNISLPYFIQFKNNSKILFYGFQNYKGTKYEFKSYTLTTSKIDGEILQDYIDELPSINFYSIQYEYNYHKSYNYNFSISILLYLKYYSSIYMVLQNEDYKESLKLYMDLIKNFKLFIQMENANENIINSNFNMYSLNDENQLKWSCQVVFSDIQNRLLTSILKNVINLSTKFDKLQVKDIVKRYEEYCSEDNLLSTLYNSDIPEEEYVDSLMKLIEISKILYYKYESKKVVEHIFKFRKHTNRLKCNDEDILKIKNLLEKSKSAPLGSIVDIVSTTIIFILFNKKYGVLHASLFWKQFIKTLDTYYEKGISIPGMESDTSPNFSHSNFQQIMEYLQCCINLKNKWSKGDSIKKNNGRLIKSSLTLLHSPNENIYIPVLQEKPPQTEEMFNKELDKFIQATDNERLYKQLKFLISDMCSFKAANIDSCFEDFIRWYSPSDWIFNNTTKEYELSKRMSENDNVWRKSWNNSIPLSAFCQTKYFDDNKSWKEMIKYLRDITFKDMLILIFPTAFKGILNILLDGPRQFSDDIKGMLKNFSEKFVECTKSNDINNYTSFLETFNMLEDILERNSFVKYYFSNFKIMKDDTEYVKSLHSNMVSGNIFDIDCSNHGKIKNLIKKTFFKEEDKFVFDNQIPLIKRFIVCCSNSRLYISSSDYETKLYTKLSI